MVKQPTKKTYKDINDLSQIKSFDPAFDLTNKKKDHKNLIIKIVLLSILLVSALRVPFCGCYIDAFLFEYLFGFAKYLIYILFIVLICLSLFKIKIKKKFFIGISLITILVSIIFSMISTIAFENSVWIKIYDSDSNKSNFVLRLSYYHNNYFAPYAIKNIWSYVYKGVNNLWFMNTRMTMPIIEENVSFAFVISGGLIGEFITSLNYWINTLLAIVLIILICLIMVQKANSKFRTWISKWINQIFIENKKTKNDEFDIETKDKDSANIKFNSLKAKGVNSQIQLNTNTPPLSFLSDTSVDNNSYSEADAKKNKEIITQIIELSNLKIKFDSIVIMPLFTEIKFHAHNTKDIDEFIKKGAEIAAALQLSQFYILAKGNDIIFEYKNTKLSKVSIKSTLINNDIGNNKSYAIAGINENNTPLFIDYKLDSSILIVGQKGSGVSMLLSCLIITSVYISSPSFLNVDIISKDKNSVIQSMINIPHIKNFISSNSSKDVKKLLDQYVEEISIRKTKLINANLSDQKSFNNMCKKSNEEPMITKVLVINNFDQIIENDFHYLSQIDYILQHGNRLGICVIFTASEMNSEMINENIIDKVQNIFVLKLESPQQSLKLMDSKRGYQLYGNGDGYLVTNKKNKNKLRFQTCYLNQIELTNIVKIINKFYKIDKN